MVISVIFLANICFLPRLLPEFLQADHPSLGLLLLAFVNAVIKTVFKSTKTSGQSLFSSGGVFATAGSKTSCFDPKYGDLF